MLGHYGNVSDAKLKSMAQHRDFILRDLAVNEVVATDIDEALGLSLAQTVTATISLPPFANSAMDGYAVRAQDVASVPVVLPVNDDLPAGSAADRPLLPGTAHRIMTGAPLPPGADAVVRVEWTDAGTSHVRIDRSVVAGAEVRPLGDDVSVGDELGRPGQEIGPADISLFASLGLRRINAYRPPRVAVVATGDELTAVGAALKAGAIFDSNSHLMAALVRSSGAEVASSACLSDEVSLAQESLIEIAQRADLVVTMGGISAGAYEVVREVFAELGGVAFASVAVQPGKPQGFGFLNRTPVITLPGNPVSALVSFELFVRPALRKIGGFTDFDRPRVRAQTTTALAVSRDRTRYLAGTLDSLRGVVAPASRRGSHLVAQVAGANCLVEVPAGLDDVAAGSFVEVLWLGS